MGLRRPRAGPARGTRVARDLEGRPTMTRRRISRLILCALAPLLPVVACARPDPTPTPTSAPLATPAPTLSPTPTRLPTPTPDPYINPLTGESVAWREALQHRPILVRYGHDRIARPPLGLASADLVYEELVEGQFITRITAVFLSKLPEAAGPIRSARPVVIDLMQQLDGALVYSGASIGVHQLLSQQPYPQYVHLGTDDDFFRSADRPAPHNLYVDLPALRQRMIAEQVDTPADLRGLVFSRTIPTGRTAAQVHIPYPGQAPVDYAYDPASGAYLRSVEGKPHIDALTGQQLAPKNVIVVYAEHRDSDIVEDTLGNLAILIKLQGQGRVQVFRDGVMVEGVWQRNEAAQLARYRDAEGNDIALKPGQSWVQIVPLEYQVEVQ